MNASMNDINYSETGGKYSALNSKLYLMDQFDLNANDATASQATTYESSQITSGETSSFNLAQEQFANSQAPLQPGSVNAITSLEGDNYSSSNAEQPLDNSNPTQNVVHAATSTAALLGVNEEAIKTISGGDETLDTNAPGHAGGGAGGVNGQTAERTVGTGKADKEGGNSNTTNIENHTSNVENHTSTENHQNHNTTNVEGDSFTDIHLGDTTLVNNVVDSTNILVNNTLNNTVNNVNNLVDSTTNLLDNTLNNVTNLGDNVLNHVENSVNLDNVLNHVDNVVTNLGDTLGDVTGDVFNVVNNTTTSLFDTLNNTTQVLGSITTVILGDLLGKIEFTLDIDLGLNSNLLNGFDLSNLANTYSLLNDSIIRNALFELTSDFLNIHIDTGLIENSPIVTSVHDAIGNVLGQVDSITGQIPVIATIDSVLDAVLPDLPFDQIDLGLNDHGVIDLHDLNITNDTSLIQDLGTSLLSDDNVLDNSLELLGDEGSLIEDVLNLNGNEVLNTNEGIGDLVDNAGEVLQDVVEDLSQDIGTILGHDNGSGLLDDIAQDLVEGIGSSGGDGGLLDNLGSVLGDEADPLDLITDGDEAGSPLDLITDGDEAGSPLDLITDGDEAGSPLDLITGGDEAGSPLDLITGGDEAGSPLDLITGGDEAGSILGNVIENVNETVDNLSGGSDLLDLGGEDGDSGEGLLDGLGGDEGGIIAEIPVINNDALAEEANVVNDLADDLGNEVSNIINLFETNMAANEESAESGSDTGSSLLPTTGEGGGDAIYDAIASTLDAANDAPDAIVNDVDMNVDATVGQVNDLVDHLGLFDHHHGGGLFG